MPRPFKDRRIAGPPPVTVYKPAGSPARELEWTYLTLDEFEALRLVDAEGLEQAQAAEQMGVSRPTVTRILMSARQKVARTLSSGAALAIEGGPVRIGGRGGGGGGMGGGRGRGQGRGRCRRGRGGPRNNGPFPIDGDLPQ